jgi:hypothetical protein
MCQNGTTFFLALHILHPHVPVNLAIKLLFQTPLKKNMILSFFLLQECNSTNSINLCIPIIAKYLFLLNMSYFTTAAMKFLQTHNSNFFIRSATLSRAPNKGNCIYLICSPTLRCITNTELVFLSPQTYYFEFRC